MRKKILGVLLCGVLLVGMTGCGNKDSKDKEESVSFDYSKINTTSNNIGKSVDVKTILNEDIKPSSYEGIQFTGNTGDLNEAEVSVGNLGWVILAEDNNNYMLTTATHTTDTIELKSVEGYNNAVQALNAYCAKYYSVEVNDKKYVARSLNMNDIEMYYKDKSDSWKQDTLGFENFNKTGVEATSYQYYPSLYAMEKGSSMDGKVGLSESPNNYDSYNNSYKSDATSTKNYLDTYYRAYTKEIKENYTNDKAYNIIFESGKAYFVATRSVSFYENKMSVYEKEKGQRDKSASAKFGIRAITSDALTQFILMNSGSKPDAFKKYMYPTRPVVVVPKSEIDL